MPTRSKPSPHHTHTHPEEGHFKGTEKVFQRVAPGRWLKRTERIPFSGDRSRRLEPSFQQPSFNGPYWYFLEETNSKRTKFLHTRMLLAVSITEKLETIKMSIKRDWLAHGRCQRGKCCADTLWKRSSLRQYMNMENVCVVNTRSTIPKG